MFENTWKTNKVNSEDRKVIFFDLLEYSTVLGAYEFEDIEPRTLSTAFEQSEIDAFTDEEKEFIAVWHGIGMGKLSALRDEKKIGYVAIVPDNYPLDLAFVNRALAFCTGTVFIEEMIHVQDGQTHDDAIVDWLKHHSKITSYAILTQKKVKNEHKKLKGHYVLDDFAASVCTSKFTYTYTLRKMVHTVLDYGPWWSKQYEKATKSAAFHDAVIEESITRVIFLDIDGVLNPATGYSCDDNIINPAFVKNLKKIVDATHATIILSSSWRDIVLSYLRNQGAKGYSKHVKLLFRLLEENGLELCGYTPLSPHKGINTRPMEIKNWLAHRPSIKSFVILDDDCWNWGILQNHVVTTVVTEENEWGLRNYKCGLTEEFADKAIEILMPADTL